MNVYFVTGLAGVGKSSHIEEAISKKKNLLVLSTDKLRFSFPFLCNVHGKELFKDHLGKILKTDPEDVDGYWGFERLATFGFIKYHLLFSEGKDLLINTVGLSNIEVIKGLEKSEPGITVKVAFIVCSKIAHRYEKRDSIDRIYEPINQSEVDQSHKWKEEIDNLNLSNYKYFDLIDCVPTEKQNSSPVLLPETYIKENAKKVIEYLSD